MRVRQAYQLALTPQVVVRVRASLALEHRLGLVDGRGHRASSASVAMVEPGLATSDQAAAAAVAPLGTSSHRRVMPRPRLCDARRGASRTRRFSHAASSCATEAIACSAPRWRLPNLRHRCRLTACPPRAARTRPRPGSPRTTQSRGWRHRCAVRRDRGTLSSQC